MFKSLGRKIVGLLLGAVLIYVLASSWILFRTMASKGADTLQGMAVQYTGQQFKNARLYMRWLEETAQVAINKPVVAKALSSGQVDDSIQPELDGLRASNLDIVSIALYGKHGETYTSGHLGGLMTLDRLEGRPATFWASGASAGWMILDPSTLYFTSWGGEPRESLFYMARIRGANGDVGLLQLEASLPRLMALFKSDPDTVYGRIVPYLIASDGQWLDDSLRRIDALQGPFPAAEGGETSVLLSDDAVMMGYPLPLSDDRIAIYITDERMSDELAMLRWLLVLVDVATALLFVWLARRLSLSLTLPLRALYRRMRATMSG
ncbi:hypothetical protein [Cohnella sp. GCM10012308]|uniref:hypothetical protein n=1 Tax=Cohnella sp. GCM10012308 TaxID=3317329 RepID=UPI0036131C5D